MIFHHIHHKMPIYKDCTFMELMLVGSSYLVLGGILLSILTKLFLGYGSIGIAFILLTLIHATRFILGKLQRIKYGKPFGYYQQALLKKLSTFSLMTYFWSAPWITRQGCWSVRRIL
jgi:conjugative transfer region protein (TIGR03750 family)